MSPWEPLFALADNSGVYSISRDDLPDIGKAAAQAGLALFRMDLAGVDRKSAFLDTTASALHFPSYFGSNWDALEDCLTDLSWIEATGYVLLIENAEDFSRNEPEEWSTAHSILLDAAAYWRKNGIRFFVMLAEK
jgi:hypothetical protein